MSELLVRAKNNTHSDPNTDLKCYKRGMPVVIMPDGHPWGKLERLPDFVVIKFPMISREKIEKYLLPQEVQDGFEEDGTTPRYIMYRRKLWNIRVDDLPAAALIKLRDTGQLIIKATDAYTGEYDYLWANVKSYFRNLLTNQDETEDL